MKITLKDVGKKYNSEWIFKNLNTVFEKDSCSVILGANGSGKSTLLKMLAANVNASEGEIEFFHNNASIEHEKVFRYIGFCSPYMELIEEFSLAELVEFNATLKPFKNKLSTSNVIEIMELEKAKNKAIKNFSSGMKQRVKLTLAILCDTPLLLLDEPTSNLDKNAVTWYSNLINENLKNRTVVVCSNSMEQEYFFCNKQLKIEDYKG